MTSALISDSIKGDLASYCAQIFCASHREFWAMAVCIVKWCERSFYELTTEDWAGNELNEAKTKVKANVKELDMHETMKDSHILIQSGKCLTVWYFEFWESNS